MVSQYSRKFIKVQNLVFVNRSEKLFKPVKPAEMVFAVSKPA